MYSHLTRNVRLYVPDIWVYLWKVTDFSGWRHNSHFLSSSKHFFHVKERAQAMQLALEIGCCCPVYKKSHWPSVCKGVISAFKRKLHFLRAFAKNDLPLGCPKIILFQDQINGIPFTIFLSFIDLLMHLGAILCPEDLPVRGFSARYVFLGTVHGKTLKE